MKTYILAEITYTTFWQCNMQKAHYWSRKLSRGCSAHGLTFALALTYRAPLRPRWTRCAPQERDSHCINVKTGRDLK